MIVPVAEAGLVVVIGAAIRFVGRLALQIHAVRAYERANAKGYDTSDLVRLIRATATTWWTKKL